MNLNQAQVDGIRAAAKTYIPRQLHGYKVAMLNGSVAGKERTVVILGEAHMKNAEHSAIGKNLIMAFDNIGLEGVFLKNYWGGKLISSSMGVFFKGIKASFGENGKHDSTITDSQNLLTALCRQQQNGPEKPDDQSPEEENPEQKITRIRKFSYLEHDHKPTFRENAFLLQLPGLIGLAGLTAATGTYKLIRDLTTEAPANQSSDLLGTTFGIMWKTTAGLGVLKFLLAMEDNGQFLKTETIKDRNGLVRNRDATMSRNIKRWLEDDPEVETLLVVVGKAHLPGIQANLINALNLQAISLDSLPICGDATAGATVH